MDNQQGTVALAYLGGIIDGEGSIIASIHRQDKQTNVVMVVKVANTNYELIEHLSAILKNLEVGHHISAPRKMKSNHKPAKDIIISGNKRLHKFLPIVIPYLVIKRKQALLALEYVNSRLLNTSRKAPYLKKEIEILSEIRKLNHRGSGHLNDYTESFKDLNLEKI